MKCTTWCRIAILAIVAQAVAVAATSGGTFFTTVEVIASAINLDR